MPSRSRNGEPSDDRKSMYPTSPRKVWGSSPNCVWSSTGSPAQAKSCDADCLRSWAQEKGGAQVERSISSKCVWTSDLVKPDGHPAAGSERVWKMIGGAARSGNASVVNSTNVDCDSAVRNETTRRAHQCSLSELAHSSHAAPTLLRAARREHTCKHQGVLAGSLGKQPARGCGS
eukprot:614467-Rhodomonas_salina.3